MTQTTNEFLYEEDQPCMNKGCNGKTKFIDGWLHCDTCKQHYMELEDDE